MNENGDAMDENGLTSRWVAKGYIVPEDQWKEGYHGRRSVAGPV